MTRQGWRIAQIIGVVVLACCLLGRYAGAQEWTAVTDERLLQAGKDADHWLMYYRTYDGWRHSPLQQITTQNVGKLVPKWFMGLGEVGDQEATPVVNNGVMIFPAGSVRRIQIFAVEAATGNVLWIHEHKHPEDLTAFSTFHPHNRGVALYKDKVYFGTLDNKVKALDAKTGKVAWEQQIADNADGYFLNHAPLIVKGKVIIGTSGPGEMGIRGFVQALNADTGEKVWQTYMVPGQGEAGQNTWDGESWKYGGGAVWMTGTYDPESNLIYIGTSNPAPFIWEMRKGDNLYTSSAVALDADTGKITWHYQYLPNDAWDYDTMDAHLLINVKRDGKEVKGALQPNKLGFLFTLDRANGTLLSATPFIKHLDWAKGYDLQTGKPIENPGKRPTMGGPAVDVCPSLYGGRNWANAAYNPQTGLLYIPANEVCMSYKYVSELVWKRGTPYVGVDWTPKMPFDNAGVVRAVDVNTGEMKWEWWNKAPLVWGGLLNTAGGLTFVGTWEGKLVALDHMSGKPLWNFHLGTPVSAPPITFTAGGKQYVAVIAGGKTRALIGMVKEPKLADHVQKTPLGGVLAVFGLPE
jgi:alcohol dehydrogenase (cytochrome c)